MITVVQVRNGHGALDCGGTGGGDEENGIHLRKIYEVEKRSRFRYGR